MPMHYGQHKTGTKPKRPVRKAPAGSTRPAKPKTPRKKSRLGKRFQSMEDISHVLNVPRSRPLQGTKMDMPDVGGILTRSINAGRGIKNMRTRRKVGRAAKKAGAGMARGR